jgi:hypothetical protein
MRRFREAEDKRVRQSPDTQSFQPGFLEESPNEATVTLHVGPCDLQSSS